MSFPTSKKLLGYMPDGTGQAFPFDALFPDGSKNVVREGWDDVAALVVWGGTDIHPSYYNESAHHTNQVYGNSTPSKRDVNEWKAMIYAKANNIPIIGVCRGAQFLNVFAGGRLIQHCEGHTNGSHLVTTSDGGTYSTTSCHHQMMYPFDIEHSMLAWSKEKLSWVYMHGYGGAAYDMKDKVEPEVVYFPSVKGIAIQGHPEWMQADSPFVVWCLEQVNSLLFSSKLTSKEIVCA